MLVNCELCGVEFNKPACHVKRVKRVFCGKNCYDEFQTNPLGDKACKICGDKFHVYPSVKHRYATCDKSSCREENKRREHNPNWRGGVTKRRKAEMSTKIYCDWRLAVFTRDSYTCTDCETRGGELHAHHVKPWAYFPELRYEVSNGSTLCESCHEKTYIEIAKWKEKITAPVALSS